MIQSGCCCCCCCCLQMHTTQCSGCVQCFINIVRWLVAGSILWLCDVFIVHLSVDHAVLLPCGYTEISYAQWIWAASLTSRRLLFMLVMPSTILNDLQQSSCESVTLVRLRSSSAQARWSALVLRGTYTCCYQLSLSCSVSLLLSHV